MKKAGFIFILLSGLASLFNYAVYPIVSRILSENQFVNIAIALALFTQLSSFMLSIVALTIGLSKDKKTANSNELIEKLQAILIHLFLAILIVFLIISPYLMSRLHLPMTLLVPICAMLTLSIFMSVITGYLNGKQKLFKLGIAISISSLLQLIFCVGVGYITKSGTAALNGMAFGSLVSIIGIYFFYKSENLPRVSSVFYHRLSIYRAHSTRKLVKFTVASAIATLAINILLILDLLIVKSRQIDSKLYTDLYVISRLVYFGGMLFAWPFLSSLDLKNNHKNKSNFYKLAAFYISITIVALVGMTVLGQTINQILLGSGFTNSQTAIRLAQSAILYKFIFLIISTLLLYFIVIRSYFVIYWSLGLSIALGIFVLLLPSNASNLYMINGLNLIAFAGMVVGLVGFNKIASPKTN